MQSQRDSNQERIYELRAKENKSTDEKAELSQLQEENNLLDSQVAIKEKSVDVSKLKAANDAKTKLEKKGYQKNYKKEAYDNQDKTSINAINEALVRADVKETTIVSPGASGRQGDIRCLGDTVTTLDGRQMSFENAIKDMLQGMILKKIN